MFGVVRLPPEHPKIWYGGAEDISFSISAMIM